MQSILLIAKNQEKRSSYLQKFCEEKKIGKFDTTLIQPPDTSFGVELVRSLQKAAFLKPMQGEDKAIILEDAQKLTTEAQNALLKLLEEPPKHTYIFLAATTDGNFLPTVLSRCQKIILQEEEEILVPERKQELEDSLKILLTEPYGAKLVLAEKLATDKDALSLWLNHMSMLLREMMLKNPENSAYPHLLALLQEAYKLVQSTNVSPRMILEHTFLLI